MKPLENAVLARFQDYLPKLTRPVRSGIHPNTAFALTQAIDYARATRRADLEKIFQSRASFYFGADRACPLAYEPSGEDFFSPCLAEADLMRRVLAAEGVRQVAQAIPAAALGAQGVPAHAGVGRRSDRSAAGPPRRPEPLARMDAARDRAGTARRATRAAPFCSGRRPRTKRPGSRASARGDYAGEHWLASFAVYLLTEN